ncbi:MAG: hypothetical protein JJU27_19220 [Gammaproteobacteria bacterium]|nr:hypothetical protein [Gammaproteobacteria bacterium]
MTPAAVFGPIISASRLDPHLALFCGLIGMQPSGPAQPLSAHQTYSLFGLKDRIASLQVLTTPGTQTGVVLVAFDPAPTDYVRNRDNALHCDALKVIDFYAPEFDAMLARVTEAGYELEAGTAAYELPEGLFREAHLWGPDNVILGLLGGPEAFFSRFASVTDRMFSEVQSISTPISDLPAVAAFYRQVLGLSIVYEYEIADPSFGEMIGSTGALNIHATNIGRRTEEPYFGLIDYGLPPEKTISLKDHGASARLGIVGAVVIVDEFPASLSTARRRGDPTGEVISLELAGWGIVQAASMRSPHGVNHLLVSAAAPD